MYTRIIVYLSNYKAIYTEIDFLPFCDQVSAVGHAAMFAAINKYIPGLVILITFPFYTLLLILLVIDNWLLPYVICFLRFGKSFFCLLHLDPFSVLFGAAWRCETTKENQEDGG